MSLFFLSDKAHYVAVLKNGRLYIREVHSEYSPQKTVMRMTEAASKKRSIEQYISSLIGQQTHTPAGITALLMFLLPGSNSLSVEEYLKKQRSFYNKKEGTYSLFLKLDLFGMATDLFLSISVNKMVKLFFLFYNPVGSVRLKQIREKVAADLNGVFPDAVQVVCTVSHTAFKKMVLAVLKGVDYFA